MKPGLDYLVRIYRQEGISAAVDLLTAVAAAKREGWPDNIGEELHPGLEFAEKVYNQLGIPDTVTLLDGLCIPDSAPRLADNKLREAISTYEDLVRQGFCHVYGIATGQCSDPDTDAALVFLNHGANPGRMMAITFPNGNGTFHPSVSQMVGQHNALIAFYAALLDLETDPAEIRTLRHAVQTSTVLQPQDSDFE